MAANFVGAVVVGGGAVLLGYTACNKSIARATQVQGAYNVQEQVQKV